MCPPRGARGSFTRIDPSRLHAASVLWLPYQAYTLLLRPSRLSDSGEASGGTAGAPSNSPLGDSALLVLLVLLFHAPPQARGGSQGR